MSAVEQQDNLTWSHCWHNQLLLEKGLAMGEYFNFLLTILFYSVMSCAVQLIQIRCMHNTVYITTYVTIYVWIYIITAIIEMSHIMQMSQSLFLLKHNSISPFTFVSIATHVHYSVLDKSHDFSALIWYQGDDDCALWKCFTDSLICPDTLKPPLTTNVSFILMLLTFALAKQKQIWK